MGGGVGGRRRRNLGGRDLCLARYTASRSRCVQQGVKVGGSVSGSTITNTTSGAVTGSPCVENRKRNSRRRPCGSLSDRRIGGGLDANPTRGRGREPVGHRGHGSTGRSATARYHQHRQSREPGHAGAVGQGAGRQGRVRGKTHVRPRPKSRSGDKAGPSRRPRFAGILPDLGGQSVPDERIPATANRSRDAFRADARRNWTALEPDDPKAAALDDVGKAGVGRRSPEPRRTACSTRPRRSNWLPCARRGTSTQRAPSRPKIHALNAAKLVRTRQYRADALRIGMRRLQECRGAGSARLPESR